MGAPAQPKLTLILHTATGNGTRRPHLRRDCARPSPTSPKPGSPLPHLRRDRAHACHICTTSAQGPGSPLSHLRREWTRPLAISVPVCAGDGLTPATSTNGTGRGVASVEHRRTAPALHSLAGAGPGHWPSGAVRAVCAPLHTASTHREYPANGRVAYRIVCPCVISLTTSGSRDAGMLTIIMIIIMTIIFIIIFISIISIILILIIFSYRRTEDDLGRAVVARRHDCRVVLVFERRGAERVSEHRIHGGGGGGGGGGREAPEIDDGDVVGRRHFNRCAVDGHRDGVFGPVSVPYETTLRCTPKGRMMPQPRRRGTSQDAKLPSELMEPTIHAGA